jgi:hypothetical protein
MNTKQTRYIKIGLVVVLAIVFVGVAANSVLTINRPSPPPSPQRPPRAASSGALAPPAAAQATPPLVPAATSPSDPRAEAPPPLTKPEASKRTWPTFELAEITAYDPFSTSKALDAVASSKSRPLSAGEGNEALPTAGPDSTPGDVRSAFTERIHAVYQRGGQTAALIGTKTVRAGDELDSGGRIVEVDQDGVLLEVKK